MDVRQNTLYLTTPGLYVSRDGLTLKVEQDRKVVLTIPVHHLESVCLFGPITITPQTLELCFEQGVGVNFFSETGYFIGRWEGIANTSVLLRRSQYRIADDTSKSAEISRNIIAGKIQNARNNVLRSAREVDDEVSKDSLKTAADELAATLRLLERSDNASSMRGLEGVAANIYFGAFNGHFKQQKEVFTFTKRSRRPPLDEINCLLSFLYALLLHDAIAALTVTGLDPFVGFLHVDRSNRPSLALDLIEEFRTWLADRLAITLINRKQISASHFLKREGGSVELTKEGRKSLLTAYQTRKQDTVTHALLEREVPIGQLMLIQARILARHIRGDMLEYLPFLVR